MQNRKLEITTGLMGQLPESQKESIDQAMITWWANIRKDGGLRLTKHGYDILHGILKIESWSVDLPDPATSGAWRGRITKRTILELDRKLEWPYYLDIDARKKTRRIVFFSSREAMMATLYGDVEQWLNSLG